MTKHIILLAAEMFDIPPLKHLMTSNSGQKGHIIIYLTFYIPGNQYKFIMLYFFFFTLKNIVLFVNISVFIHNNTLI